MENLLFHLLTLIRHECILKSLRSYWFASRAGGTEAQTVLTDCLGFLFKPPRFESGSGPPSPLALLLARHYLCASRKRYVPTIPLCRRR